MTIPRCPYCDAQGLKHLAKQQAGAFTLVYCGKCGAIHGIIPTPRSPAGRIGDGPAHQEQVSPSPTVEVAASLVPPSAETLTPVVRLGNIDLSLKKSLTPGQVEAKMRAMQHFAPSSRYLRIVHDDGPPFCPQHHVEMQELVIPAGYRNAGRKLWVCPQFEECEQWEVAE